MRSKSEDKNHLTATDSASSPGNFPLGSLESRAAARAMLRRSEIITTVVITTGLPWPKSTPVIESPDTSAHYEAPDGSEVEVICREYEAGKFAAYIHQTWKDGSEYHGHHLVRDLASAQKLRRLADSNKPTAYTS
jgi:hypothetical protein